MTDKYDLILKETGENETGIALAIINHWQSRFKTGLQIDKQVQAILNRFQSLPVTIFQNCPLNVAETLCGQFRRLGATVEIKPVRLFFSETLPTSVNERFSSILRSMEESKLAEWAKKQSITEAYRFIYSPTFHPDTIIRIWKHEDKYSIVAKSATDYSLLPDAINQHIAIDLSSTQWETIAKAINQNQFWTYQPRKTIGLDGVQWVIEAFANGEYHMANEHSPHEGEIYNIGNAFINLLPKNFKI